MTPLALALTLSLVAAPKRDAPAFEVEAEARVGVGGLSGRGSHALPAALSVVEAEVEPSAHWGMLDVNGDLQLGHEETWATPLRETAAKGSLELELRPWRWLRVAAEGGVAGVARPGWPDLYQPVDGDPALGLLPTDRGSHLDVWLQGRALWLPAPHHFVRARYRFTRTDSFDDPAFDAVGRPNHLTPFDNDQHAAELSWRALIGPLHPSVSLGASRQDWFFVFSRDAGTGVTHVGQGGDPANPLLAENALELEPEVELEAWPEVLSLTLAWRARLVDDPWQGYLSRFESRLRFEAELHAGPKKHQLGLDARLEVVERLYGDRAYAAGDGHPPLDWGERRESRAASVSLRARWPERAPLRLYAELSGASFITNFPDYVAGVYPASQAYDVARDWRHGRALVGVELALER
ncbi:MAG: hypothetical protein HYS27_02285 [Deltaproteobacteria bacterium]|nr:hypothetical protein [Deltaproteobacteria bacterium]